MKHALLLTVSFLLAARPAPAGDIRDVKHPFVLWTAKDLADLRRRVRTDHYAKLAFERLKADLAGQGPRGRKDPAAPARRLLMFAITDDAELAAAEKKRLLRVLNSPVPRGGAQWLTVLRYDLLYDRLSGAERKAFEQMARVYIRNAVFENAVFNPAIFNDSAHYSRYDAKKYTRTNWLPNIIWPRKVSANLLAAALKDEALIRRTWAHYGSWKWYFDEYLCDEGFYAEEFSKMGSTPGAMLVYCLAVEHLGLGELGFGYRGAGGATMRGHIRSLIHLGYPRVDIASDRPHWPMVTMGDLRQVGSSHAGNFPAPAFQHALVVGYLPDGSGGNLRWRAHGAWGGETRGRLPQWDGYSGFTPKMQLPLWFELGAKRWPEDGYAWFLAQMRPPGDAVYLPSLWFGLEAIDPANVRPPAAPSAVWPERGIVMLRAEQSPKYWHSPAGAVAMRLGSNYAHNVRDAFALLGYYALNRPIYLNRQTWPGYATGWSRSIQSHCGLTVDGAEPDFTDATTVRSAFPPAVRFVAATSGKVYRGVTLTRALMLTGEYLLDATRAASDDAHEYTWIVHALGRLRDADGRWRPAALPAKIQPLRGVRALDCGAADWQATADQVCTLPDPAKAALPAAWYDRKVGVCLRMLGEPGTRALAAETPPPLASRREGKKKVTVEVPSEVGGVTLLAWRKAPATTFVALHEPFEGAAGSIRRFERIARDERAVAVRVEAEGFRDRLMFRLVGEPSEPLSISGGGESFTFADYAYVRLAGGAVDVAAGALKAMRLRVGPGAVRLRLNGRAASFRREGEVLIYPAD